MAAARKVKKTAAPKSSRTKPSTKRKKAPRASKAAKPSAAKKSIASKNSKTKSTRNSVDLILVKFDKRRTEHQTKLTTVQKKIAQLEAKTKAYQAEIVSLKEAASSAERTLGNLDQERDRAVRDMLEQLGIKLVSETVAEPSPKPKLLQAKPPLDTVFRSPTNSNGNRTSEQELPSNSSSDDLLDDELRDDDHS